MKRVLLVLAVMASILALSAPPANAEPGGVPGGAVAVGHGPDMVETDGVVTFPGFWD